VVERLIATSMNNGAISSSQNMIGDSVHAIVHKAGVEKLVASLHSASRSARVDVFRIGGSSARIIVRNRRNS
jgi:hypothetical protein